jgi:MFS family permease
MTAILGAREPRARVRSGASIVVLSLGALDLGLETSIVLPALPALAQHYGASLREVGWFATAFQLVAVAVVPLLGRLGDLVGKRRTLLVAFLAFGPRCSQRPWRSTSARPPARPSAQPASEPAR